MWIIQNTQTELVKQPGRITPAVRCYLGMAGHWTVNQPAMQFTERAHAEDVIKDSGLNVGRNEDRERNLLNVIDAVEVSP